jgi:hypothetical protein
MSTRIVSVVEKIDDSNQFKQLNLNARQPRENFTYIMLFFDETALDFMCFLLVVEAMFRIIPLRKINGLAKRM